MSIESEEEVGLADIGSLVTKQYENIAMSATQDEYEDNGTGGSFLNPSDMEYSNAATDDFEYVAPIPGTSMTAASRRFDIWTS